MTTDQPDEPFSADTVRSMTELAMSDPKHFNPDVEKRIDQILRGVGSYYERVYNAVLPRSDDFNPSKAKAELQADKPGKEV